MADFAVVDPAAGPVVDSAAGALGFPGSPRLRLVRALPVAGVEMVPAVAAGQALALLSDSSAAVAGDSGVYVSRMVWALRE